MSAAGESPPVQIMTPSLSCSITFFSLQALRNLTPAALVASRTRRRTAAIFGIRFAAALIRAGPAHDEEAMIARPPFREGDARHADRGLDIGISTRVLDFQAENEFAIRVHRPGIGDAHYSWAVTPQMVDA